MDGVNRRIDYKRLAQAQSFYEDLGYLYLEVPWHISAEAVGATLPAGRRAFPLLADTWLVGSAEQSFIQMMLDGRALGRHCAITPCFRDEEEDALHMKCFMKLELFEFLPASDPEAARKMQAMLADAKAFFSRFLHVAEEKTAEGIDIVCAQSGVELGSYGIRRLRDGRGWVYGTGLAEPRLGHVLSLCWDLPAAA